MEEISILSNCEFITTAQSLKWTFAKTMPHIPHEYIVRKKFVDDITYIALFTTIKAHGEWREWNGTQYQYLAPGDGYKYWKMTDNIEESIIINRAKETD